MANSFDNKLTASIGTADVTVYTPGASVIYTTIIGFTVSNSTASSIVIDIFIRDIDSTEVYLLKGTTLNAGAATVPVGGEQKLVIKPNQELCVRSDTASSADAIVSVLEIT